VQGLIDKRVSLAPKPTFLSSIVATSIPHSSPQPTSHYDIDFIRRSESAIL
jgi:hypothetical protein